MRWQSSWLHIAKIRMYFRSGDNIRRGAIKSKQNIAADHRTNERTNERMIFVVAYGTLGRKAQGGGARDREGHRKADRKLLRADTRSHNPSRQGRAVWARVRAGATHHDPPPPPLCATDLCRNFVTSLSGAAAQFGHGGEYRNLPCVLPRKTKTVQP